MNTQNNTKTKRKTSKLSIASLIICILCIILIGLIHKKINFKSNLLPLSIILLATFIVVNLALEVIALIQIRKNKRILAGFKLIILCLLLTVFSFVSGFFVTAQRFQEISHLMQCGHNIGIIGNTLIRYSNNHNNYPKPDKWCDLLVKNYGLIDIKSFRCVANKKAICSFSINPNAEPDSPKDIVLVFESKPGWNQFGGPELLNLKNHKGLGCNILFNNGYAEFVKTENINKLNWGTDKNNKDPNEQ
jgi:hypothetical protein